VFTEEHQELIRKTIIAHGKPFKQGAEQAMGFYLPNDVFDRLTGSITIPAMRLWNGIPYFAVGQFMICREDSYGGLLDDIWARKMVHAGS